MNFQFETTVQNVNLFYHIADITLRIHYVDDGGECCDELMIEGVDLVSVYFPLTKDILRWEQEHQTNPLVSAIRRKAVRAATEKVIVNLMKNHYSMVIASCRTYQDRQKEKKNGR